MKIRELLQADWTVDRLYIAGLSYSESIILTDALNRLTDYEDTGLEPGEVQTFTDEHT